MRNKCSYCGKDAEFQLKNSKYCCSKSANQCPTNRLKNSNGLKHNYKLTNKKSNYLFTDNDRIKSNQKQIKAAKENSFGKDVKRLTENARKYLLEERGYKCEICRIVEWQGKNIIFEIDHIDGDNRNNEKNNLRILCPNCHSQTDTWRGRNTNNGKKKHTDEIIISTFLRMGNIYQTLKELNMAPKGANYETIRKILNRHKINY